MKRLLVSVPFAAYFLALNAYAATPCEPIGRAMAQLAAVPTFTMAISESPQAGVALRLEITPEGVATFAGQEEVDNEPRAPMMEAMAAEGKRIAALPACVLAQEAQFDNQPMLIFAPEGEANGFRVWIGKQDGRIHRMSPDGEGEVRFIYPH